jgi:uncharacterized protein YdaU (DUF1376 family)
MAAMMATNNGDRSRFPYFPFYVDDWLSSSVVGGLTLEQRAVYLMLLLMQWKTKNGLLPNDEAALARWCGLQQPDGTAGARWAKVGRPVLRQCFTERGEGLVNGKLRELWERARTRSVQATRAAEHRWRDSE